MRPYTCFGDRFQSSNHGSVTSILTPPGQCQQPYLGRGRESSLIASFSPSFSPSRFPALPLPHGGILADEMGLGKTVEMLALILAHQWEGEGVSHGHRGSSPGGPSAGGGGDSPAAAGVAGGGELQGKVACLCGDMSERGCMVQCERCLSWQHTSCCNYSESDGGEIFVCTKCLLEKVRHDCRLPPRSHGPISNTKV